MRQGRVELLLMLFVAFLAGAGTVRAQATTNVDRVTVPFVFDSVNPCNGEAVVVAGELMLTTRTTVDGQGRTHEAFNLVASHVRGEGESGTGYMAVGGQREHRNFDENAALPFVDTFTDIFNLVSAGGVDNFTAKTLFHITVTADGTVRADIARVEEGCRG